MYNKVATDMNFVSREQAIAKMWNEKDIIRKSYHHRDGSEMFFSSANCRNRIISRIDSYL